jgi:hypothetical protein
MTTDPFENFERSRIGWSIPVALFVFGGFLTYLAVNSLHGVVLREENAARAAQKQERLELQSKLPAAAVDDVELEKAGSNVSTTKATSEP